MRKAFVVSVLIGWVLCAVSVAADFKPYPGATQDQKATQQAREAAAAAKATGVETTVYTTPDSFEKVTAFYKGIGKEYAMPRASGTTGKPKKGPGYDLWEAYFIFDGAGDLSTSGLWAKVQRPYVGGGPRGKIGLQGGSVQAPGAAPVGDVRDVTAIVLTQKK